jgi:hypothetical protein
VGIPASPSRRAARARKFPWALSGEPEDRCLYRRRVAGVLALSTAAVGAVSLLLALAPAHREALQLDERIGTGPVLRLWRRILLMASRWGDRVAVPVQREVSAHLATALPQLSAQA